MSLSAVIFDLDGTLVDTLEDIGDSMNAVLESMGFAGHDIASYKTMIGAGIDILAKKALPPHSRSENIVRESVSRMKEEYSLRWHRSARLYPGIPEMLTGLNSRGIPMAILSNKLDEFTKMVAERFLSRWTFRRIAGANPSCPLKPDPASALRIAGDFDWLPGETALVGDSGSDMQTAAAAGMFPVGALWGFRTARELRECGAAELLSKPEELLALFSP